MKWLKIGEQYVNIELVAGVRKPYSGAVVLLFAGGATMDLSWEDATNFLQWLDYQRPEDVSNDPKEARRPPSH